MKTVFILGAGASRSAGGPLMKDFIEVASKIHRRGESGWAAADFANIMDARRKLQVAYAKSSIDLDNIENLFSTFEMASLIQRLAELPAKVVEKLPTSLRYVILRTLEQSILFPINGRDSHVPAPYPYDAFAQLIIELARTREASPVAVINFNYDLCFDYAIAAAGRKVFYGVEQQHSVPKGAIHHYKVHGSLNWFRNEDGTLRTDPITLLPMNTYWERLGLNSPAERPIDTMEILHGPAKWGEGILPNPIIVPPTWNKGWYQQALSSVWKAAASALASAENIIVIGYSLPPSDQFFRSFYSLSTISESIIENFFLFDPSGDKEMIARFSSLLGPAITGRDKFTVKQLKFSSAIKFVAAHFGLTASDFEER